MYIPYYAKFSLSNKNIFREEHFISKMHAEMCTQSDQLGYKNNVID